MDKNEYLKHPGLSNSRLCDFKQSPLHYKYRLDNPEPDTKATLTGSAFHYLCFEPGKIKNYMIVLDEHDRPVPSKDYRNAENKAWKDTKITEALRLKKEIISSDDFGVAQDMYEAVEKDSHAFELLRAGGNQYEKFDTWEWDGILFKKKTDIYNEYFQGDLKSCDNADPWVFSKQIFNWDYDQQGGMYSDAERILKDTAFFNPFYIIAVEKSPPYGVSVHELTNDVLQYGCDQYRKLAKQLEECRKKNHWPGYHYKYTGYNQVELPAWRN